MRFLLYIILFIDFAMNLLAQRFPPRVRSQYCVTPENLYGVCTQLAYCPQVANVFNLPNKIAARQYVLALHRSCGTRSINGDPVICCQQQQQQQQQQQLIRTTFPTTRAPTIVTERPWNPFFPTTKDPQNYPTTQFPTTRPTFGTTTTSPIASTMPTRPLDGQDNNVGARTCRDPKLMEGTCMPLAQCKVLTDELIQRQTDPVFVDYLRASNTQCGQIATNVCCPLNGTDTEEELVTRRPSGRNINDISSILPTIDDGCGKTLSSFKKIVGGEVSKIGAWPWIALLGYGKTAATSSFKCGGALITARHVITAAHCIQSDLIFVRLGEHDIRTDTETTHIDVPVLKTVAHPKFNKKIGHSDIAIIFLADTVRFTDLIGPICLPQSRELRQKSYVKYSPFVIGWGKTEEGGNSSDVLQELQIPIFNNAVCEESYQKKRANFTRYQFNEATLCAGILSGGHDTCQGDSGGPLMIPETYGASARFYLIGIVSYGIGCARPDIPGVYTSVQYFMDWILQTLANGP